MAAPVGACIMTIRRMARELMPPRLRRIVGRIRGTDAKPRVRRYIPADTGVEAFFKSLEEVSVKCVVLRWFEDLPRVKPGEDVDMLVADDDLPKIGKYLDNYAGAVPCDIYSVAGAVGARYKDRPYFPATLARRMIERREMLGGLYPVPCVEDHFFSLAYHAVYQKGPVSGLCTSLPGITALAKPDHDYAGVLNELSGKLGLGVEIDLDSLDRVLEEAGYRPSQEVLKSLGSSNPWVAARFFS